MVEPGVEQSPEMLELAALARPGPFGKRTQELGYYVGMIDRGIIASRASLVGLVGLFLHATAATGVPLDRGEDQ